MKHCYLLAAALLLMVSAAASGQQRKEVLLSDGWLFQRGSGDWQEVSVPHDWAIEGPFDKQWDLQRVAITQNGETEATEKSGRSGALPWIGEGEYKTTFSVEPGYDHAYLLFDGAMADPHVYVNGHLAGHWAYGYNSFRVDVTPYLRRPVQGKGSTVNELRVTLSNLDESSRWYPGAGIYRPVTLVMTQRERIDSWQTFFQTESIADGKAVVNISTQALGIDGGKGFAVEMELRNPKGLAAPVSHLPLDGEGRAATRLTIEKPRLWSPEKPELYALVVKLYHNGLLVDRTEQRVGIRTVSCTAEGGFQLNGKTRKIKGVCLHHDLGPLGAAVSEAALIRQIKLMKDMGADAIRTAHNMPSQMQMDICDSLGMMVMAESFDMWRYPKCKNGYARLFDEWAERDIEHLVLAHRNHPSIVMWSIGNEIPEQWSQEGVEIATRLQDLCHQLDPTRPVTQGMDRIDDAMKSGFAQVMDVPGMNYRLHRYEKAYSTLPHGFLLGSETASTVSSRGVYKFPVKETDHGVYSDGQCSGYDVEWCPWSNLPDDDWRLQDDKPWTIGEFVWTGFDYLGEPTPYDEYWPSRSSYFGICDLAGLPKDRYYLYRSHWNRQSHTIHLLPHWTWGRERLRKVTPVYCYTDCPEGELFLNGKSQGRISKQADSRLDRYRLRWNDVRYEPGELRVVVYDASGKAVGEQTLSTAGKPESIDLKVWTQQSPLSPAVSRLSPLKADGRDLAFVTVSLADSDGNLVPNASHWLRFEVEGAGKFRAVCNGDATSLELFTVPAMHLFSGQLVVVVQAADRPGTLTLRVIDDEAGLSKEVEIPVSGE